MWWMFLLPAALALNVSPSSSILSGPIFKTAFSSHHRNATNGASMLLSSPIDTFKSRLPMSAIPSITQMPSPLSSVDGLPVFASDAKLPPNYASGFVEWGYLYTGVLCSMGAAIAGLMGDNAQSCSCRNDIASWYKDYATASTTLENCQTTHTIESGLAVKQAPMCSESTSYQLATPYNLRAQCCDECRVRVSAVQLIYWPPEGSNATGAAINKRSAYNVTSATAPMNGSYGVVQDGFTFTSPSVYVVYSNIAASASCAVLEPSNTAIGGVYDKVTRAYAPDTLSTAQCAGESDGGEIQVHKYILPNGTVQVFQDPFRGWRKINYTEWYDPPTDTDLVPRYQSCFPGRTIAPDFASYMFAKPQLSFPQDVTDIDSVWKDYGVLHTCYPLGLGVWDPPRALGKATALTDPPVTTTIETRSATTPAAPGSAIPALQSTPTAVPGSSKSRDGQVSDPKTDIPVASDPPKATLIVQSSATEDPANGRSTVQALKGSIAADPSTKSSHAKASASPTTSAVDPSSPNHHSKSSDDPLTDSSTSKMTNPKPGAGGLSPSAEPFHDDSNTDHPLDPSPLRLKSTAIHPLKPSTAEQEKPNDHRVAPVNHETTQAPQLRASPVSPINTGLPPAIVKSPNLEEAQPSTTKPAIGGTAEKVEPQSLGLLPIMPGLDLGNLRSPPAKEDGRSEQVSHPTVENSTPVDHQRKTSTTTSAIFATISGHSHVSDDASTMAPDLIDNNADPLLPVSGVDPFVTTSHDKTSASFDRSFAASTTPANSLNAEATPSQIVPNTFEGFSLPFGIAPNLEFPSTTLSDDTPRKHHFHFGIHTAISAAATQPAPTFASSDNPLSFDPSVTAHALNPSGGERVATSLEHPSDIGYDEESIATRSKLPPFTKVTPDGPPVSFGPSNAHLVDGATIHIATRTTITAADQTFKADRSGLLGEFSPSGPAISFDSSNALLIHGATIHIATQTIITALDQAPTFNQPSLAGESLPSGPAISLDSSGALIVDGSTIHIATWTVVTFADQTFTAGSSASSVGGLTLPEIDVVHANSTVGLDATMGSTGTTTSSVSNKTASGYTGLQVQTQGSDGAKRMDGLGSMGMLLGIGLVLIGFLV